MPTTYYYYSISVKNDPLAHESWITKCRVLFGEEQALSLVVKLMVHVSDSCVTQDTMFAHGCRA
jgi:hypothetical protein